MEPEDSMHRPQTSANNPETQAIPPYSLVAILILPYHPRMCLACRIMAVPRHRQSVTGFVPRRPGFAPGTIYRDCAGRSGNEAGLSMFHNETPSYIISVEYSPPPPYVASSLQAFWSKLRLFPTCPASSKRHTTLMVLCFMIRITSGDSTLSRVSKRKNDLQ